MSIIEDGHTDFVDAMRSIVEAHPDVIYKPMRNFYFYSDGSPACLFGHIFFQLGITLDDIAYATSNNVKLIDESMRLDPNSARIRFVLKSLGYTENFYSVAEVAQIYQDEKKKWSEVLEEFRLGLVQRGIANMYWR